MSKLWSELAESEELVLIQFRGMWFLVGRHAEDKTPYPVEADGQLASTPFQRFKVAGYDKPYVRLKYQDVTSSPPCEMLTDVHEEAIFSVTRVGKESLISVAQA